MSRNEPSRRDLDEIVDDFVDEIYHAENDNADEWVDSILADLRNEDY